MMESLSTLPITWITGVVGARLASEDEFAHEGRALLALTFAVACLPLSSYAKVKDHLCNVAVLSALLGVHAFASVQGDGAQREWLRAQIRSSLCCGALTVISRSSSHMGVVARATLGTLLAASWSTLIFPPHGGAAVTTSPVYAVACGLAATCAAEALRGALPGSFSIGEAGLLCQAATLLVFDTLSQQATAACASSEAECLVELLRRGVTGTLLSCLVLAGAGSVRARIWRKWYPRANERLGAALFGGLVVSVAAKTLSFCSAALEEPNPRASRNGVGTGGGGGAVAWVARYAARDTVVATLLAYWVALLSLGLYAVERLRSSGALLPIEVRKLFHMLALALFVPALLFRPHFLAIAYGVALCVGLLAETTRVLKVQGAAAAIEEYLRRFTDERDDAAPGGAITTHLYLLAGCAAPLWLYVGFAPARDSGAGAAALGAPHSTRCVLHFFCLLLFFCLLIYSCLLLFSPQRSRTAPPV